MAFPGFGAPKKSEEEEKKKSVAEHAEDLANQVGQAFDRVQKMKEARDAKDDLLDSTHAERFYPKARFEEGGTLAGELKEFAQWVAGVKSGNSDKDKAAMEQAAKLQSTFKLAINGALEKHPLDHQSIKDEVKEMTEALDKLKKGGDKAQNDSIEAKKAELKKFEEEKLITELKRLEESVKRQKESDISVMLALQALGGKADAQILWIGMGDADPDQLKAHGGVKAPDDFVKGVERVVGSKAKIFTRPGSDITLGFIDSRDGNSKLLTPIPPVEPPSEDELEHDKAEKWKKFDAAWKETFSLVSVRGKTRTIEIDYAIENADPNKPKVLLSQQGDRDLSAIERHIKILGEMKLGVTLSEATLNDLAYLVARNKPELTARVEKIYQDMNKVNEELRKIEKAEIKAAPKGDRDQLVKEHNKNVADGLMKELKSAPLLEVKLPDPAGFKTNEEKNAAAEAALSTKLGVLKDRYKHLDTVCEKAEAEFKVMEESTDDPMGVAELRSNFHAEFSKEVQAVHNEAISLNRWSAIGAAGVVGDVKDARGNVVSEKERQDKLAQKFDEIQKNAHKLESKFPKEAPDATSTLGLGGP